MGTPTGAPHEALAEIRAFCRDLFARPAYQARIRKQWDTGTLPPVLETLFLHYAFDKPAQTVAPPSMASTRRNIWRASAPTSTTREARLTAKTLRRWREDPIQRAVDRWMAQERPACPGPERCATRGVARATPPSVESRPRSTPSPEEVRCP
jgi:hypothetical protein